MIITIVIYSLLTIAIHGIPAPGCEVCGQGSGGACGEASARANDPESFLATHTTHTTHREIAMITDCGFAMVVVGDDWLQFAIANQWSLAASISSLWLVSDTKLIII